MSHRAMWIYPWDLADEGIESVISYLVKDVGINAVALATAYHSVEHLRPRSLGGKFYRSSQASLYFEPDSSFFLRPNCGRMLVHLSKATLFYTDLWRLVTNMKRKPNRGQFFCTIVTWQLKIQIVLKEMFMGILCPMLCAQLIQMLEPMLLGYHVIWLQSESRS